MSQQLINIGTADQGNGDPIRTAFNKVNENFTELFEQVSASVVVDTTPPAAPSEGNLWWDPEGGRLYISYDSNWIDASPVDGVGISSTNELVNGAYTVSLGSNGTVTFPDLLTIANSVIGKSSSTTITEETTDGTISQTTDIVSQMAVDADSVVITKSISQTVNDGITETVNSVSSTIEVISGGVQIRRTAEPDGPNNTEYSEVAVSNNGAYMSYVSQNVSATNTSSLLVTGSTIELSIDLDNVEKNWIFDFDGNLTVPEASTIEGTNDFTIQSEVDGNRSGLFLNGNSLVGSAILYANGVATIRSDSDGTAKDWAFDKSGTITTPLLLPKIFTAVLDEAHMVVPVTLEADPWQYGVEFAVNPDGSVQTQMDDPTYPVDPGYSQGSVFRFTEADHGIPGYTFDITLNFTFDEETQLFVTNPSVTSPPEYPATVESTGAIKLTADTNSWVFGTDGGLTFPDNTVQYSAANLGDLEVDGSTILTIPDQEIAIQSSYRETVSAEAIEGSGAGEFIADITANDDITVVNVSTWEFNAGSTEAPIWAPVALTGGTPGSTFVINVPGVEFVPGTTYTFRNSQAIDSAWTFRPIGTIAGPGGVILSNETGDLGGGETYRELAIELPTPDELNEHRWVFDNDGDFTTPGNITVTGGLLTTYGAVVDVAVNTDNYLGLHANPNAGVLVRSSDTELNYSDWRFEVDGSVTFPDTSVQTTAYPGTLAAARLPYYDNTEARDTAITSPENGMIVIVGGDVYFYGAAQWRQLTVAA